MLHHAPASLSQADANLVRIDVGIDTSRYGHYSAFLRDDLQPAVGELQFVESADGYAQLRTRLEQIVAKLGTVHFAVRLDVANTCGPQVASSPTYTRVSCRLADVARHPQ